MSASVAVMASSAATPVLTQATPPGVFHEAKDAPSAGQPTKLFIGGISRHTTTKQLRDHFSQFGRVLDCVAMRTQDGQPRGFGYVTLDSNISAERCLQEPQLIDNRVVDMKRAVPEGSGVSPSGSAGFKQARANMGMMTADFNMDMNNFNEWAAPYGNWWSGQPFQDSFPMSAKSLDCLDLLSDSCVASPHGLLLEPARVDPLDGMGLLLPPVLSSEHDCQKLTPGVSPKMSANAPEFVPLGAPSSQKPEPEENRSPAGNMASTMATKRTRTRAPLGELTNIVQVGDLLKPFASPSKKNDMGRGHLSVANIADQTENQVAVPPKKPVSCSANLFVHDDGLENADTKGSAPPSPTEAQEHEEQDAECASVKVDMKDSASTSSSDSEADEQVDLNDLPSLGSATHGTGECKRCNFFAKGRCQNGKDCSFCHFQHETRKPSRQEKRERREQRLAQDGDANSSELLADTAPVRMKRAPPPLDMTGEVALAPPPGLVAWEPEIEVNPFSFFPVGRTMPGLFDESAFQQFLSSTPMSSSLLSTVPSSAPTVHSTPFATPLATPTNSGAVTEAHRMLPGGLGTTTSGTQTGNYMCRRCEIVATPSTPTLSSPESDAHKWPRDELLRLRSSLMKASGEERSLPIRTATNTALGLC